MECFLLLAGSSYIFMIQQQDSHNLQVHNIQKIDKSTQIIKNSQQYQSRQFHNWSIHKINQFTRLTFSQNSQS